MLALMYPPIMLVLMYREKEKLKNFFVIVVGLHEPRRGIEWSNKDFSDEIAN